MNLLTAAQISIVFNIVELFVVLTIFKRNFIGNNCRRQRLIAAVFGMLIGSTMLIPIWLIVLHIAISMAKAGLL